MQRQDLEAVQEIETKPPLLHCCMEIHMGGANEAKIYGNFFDATYGTNDFFL